MTAPTSSSTNSNSACFAPGCGLWIVADDHTSKWTRRIDWYLNFQIMKAGLHHRRDLSGELQSILKDMEPPPSDLAETETQRLMISSPRLLPVPMVVMIPFAGDLRQWVTECQKTWQGLKSPRLRVFLPDGIDPKAVQKAHNEFAANDRVEFIDEGQLEKLDLAPEASLT